MKKILVTGAGGFIGGHLVKRLYEEEGPHTIIRAVDIKPLKEWHQIIESPGNAQNWVCDLKLRENCADACEDVDEVYNLAADMGGMGFIEHNKALCMLSVLVNTHLLQSALEAGVKRYFYSSSACIYPAHKQTDENVTALKESDAYPAAAEDGYGWEKLFSERMCRHFTEDFCLETRVARFHNVYGPHGSWDGGREKAPAAICRKVIHAVHHGEDQIEIWGDGNQTRSFMYIDDCIRGILEIMHSDVREPLNLGSNQLVTVNGLVDLVEDLAGVDLKRLYNLKAPKGVNGRNSDNTLFKSHFGWEPKVSLRLGLYHTFNWIREEYKKIYGNNIQQTG